MYKKYSKLVLPHTNNKKYLQNAKYEAVFTAPAQPIFPNEHHHELAEEDPKHCTKM